MPDKQQLLSIYLSINFIFAPLYSADLTPDGTTNTTLDSARNNVPIVNIANPNANGLSHNKFTNYNVHQEGLILNNAKTTEANTQLGGFIYGNPNLNTNAQVILNEVTSTNPTTLQGYTEVAGEKADIVIANPNGMSINGAGFINAGSVTLTTGTPNIVNNNLQSFTINGGEIEITGNGLDTTSQDSAAIYTEALKVNVAIHAKDLHIAVGKNRVDYPTKAVTKIADSDKALLLDASTQGGMYANRIHLVGTGAGVGVKLPPEMLATQGEISITHDGTITLGQMSAKGDITVESKQSDITVTDSVYSQESLALHAGTDMVVRERVVAEDQVTITTQRLTNESNITATGHLNLQTSTLNNQGEIRAGESDINATTSITNHGTLYGTNRLTLTTQDLNNSTGMIESAGALRVDANSMVLDNSTIYSSGTLDFTTNALINPTTSQIESNGSLSITASGDLLNNADIHTNDTLTLSAEVLENNATLSSVKAMHITATTLTNNAMISTASDLSINTENLTNNATLFSTGAMHLYTTQTLRNNLNAVIYAMSDMHLAGSETNTSTQSMINDRGFIETYRGDMDIYADSLENLADEAVIETREVGSGALRLYRYTGFFGTRNWFFDRKETYTYDNGEGEEDNEATRYWLSYRDTAQNRALDEGYVEGSSGYNSRVLEMLREYYSEFNVQSNGATLYYIDLGNISFSNHVTEIDVTTRITEDILISEPEHTARLASGGNLNLYVGDVENYLSEISAAEDMTFESNALTNHVEQLMTREYVEIPYSGITETSTLKDEYISTIQAGGSITGSAGLLTNANARENQTLETTTQRSGITTPTISDRSTTTQLTLPTSEHGLFVLAKDPTSSYLIETNPEFTIYENFISSDYLMNRIEFSPDITTKRVGDAFYENQLIRQSIFEQTGRRFLTPTLQSDQEQFQYLMDNAITTTQELNLTPGIALSANQINALTRDMVWMEERIVAGERVLTPVVYLASTSNMKIRGGQIVAGEDIDLAVEAMTNSGTLQAGDRLAINAKQGILNEGGRLQASGDLTLTAQNDIQNISGDISGANVTLTSTEGSITNTRYTKKLQGNGRTATTVAAAGAIRAKGSLELNAAKDITVTASNLQADGVLSMEAKDVTIQSTKQSESVDERFSGGYYKRGSTQHLTSNIDAGSIRVDADDQTTIRGAGLRAQDDITINTTSLAIESVKDSTYYNYKKERKGSFLSSGAKTIIDRSKTNVISSTLQSNTINILSRDTTLIASKIKADEATIVAEILTLVSDKNRDYESIFEDSSGLLTRTIESKGHIQEQAVAAEIDAKKIIFNGQTLLEDQLNPDNLLKQISSEYELNRDQINQIKAQLENKEWHEKSTTLSKMGMLIVQVVTAIATAGAGNALIGTALDGIAKTMVAAAVDSMASQMVAQLATSAITGEGMSLDLNSMLEGALRSAALAGITTQLDLEMGYATKNTEGQIVAVDQLSYADKARQAITKGLAQKAIYGGSIESIMANRVGGVAFEYIGHELYSDNPTTEFGQSATVREIVDVVPKEVMHGLIGGAIGELSGGDFTASAINTATSHVVGDYVKNELVANVLNGDITIAQYEATVTGLSGVVGSMVALAVDEGLSAEELQIANNVGESVVENNALIGIAPVLEALLAGGGAATTTIGGTTISTALVMDALAVLGFATLYAILTDSDSDVNLADRLALAINEAMAVEQLGGVTDSTSNANIERSTGVAAGAPAPLPPDPDDDGDGNGELPEWNSYNHKHVASKNQSWKQVLEGTKNGPAKYKHGTDIKNLETNVWRNGKKVTNGKDWKVMEFDNVVGAKNGQASKWVRVERSGNTIHGHPITKSEYLKLLK
jgi:filamentous hemagglutinin